MHKPLLIEIGLEELPAVPLLKEADNIEAKWRKVCKEAELESDVEFYYTPRRLVLWHPRFPVKQQDRTEEFFGPPEAVAFQNGEPTKAALGFAKKCGIELEQAGRAEKGGKSVLYHAATVPGQEVKALVGPMVKTFLESLHFGKTMRWGSLEESFIRPIRWLMALHGDESLSVEAYGVTSGTVTYGHRMDDYGPQQVLEADRFHDFLEKRGVILDQAARRKKILADFAVIEKENPGLSVQVDEELLDEIVAITEYPTALVGAFDEDFLELPPEVIITSMKEHQRYFAVYENGKIANRFVVVANALADDFSKIVSGNEKVLRARLADGLFFWKNDLQRGLSNEGLENLMFVEGLGSIQDKVERERKIAKTLADAFGLEDKAGIDRAVSLAKADLMSEMVYEFTELQGVMGSYYAKAAGESDDVAQAIQDQYLPKGEEAELPVNDFTAVVSLAAKLDNLLGLFSVGKIPTGSRDPFALRRAANGVIRIVADRGFSFDLAVLLSKLAADYNDFDTGELKAFIEERLLQHLKVNPSIVKAVLATGESDLRAVFQKVEALAAIVESDGFRAMFDTFKRVANITKDVELSVDLPVNPEHFESGHEQNLYDKFRQIQAAEYQPLLEALFGLKPDLEAFFEHVMVNADDETLRTNRKNLIASVYKAFLQVADIKEISV